MDKKYKLTETTKHHNGRTLYQIQALRDFGDVKAGDLGGWIEIERNLSHEGEAWVSDNACVYDEARVYGNACISGEACVYGDVRVSDNACVYGYVRISGNAWVCGDTHIS